MFCTVGAPGLPGVRGADDAEVEGREPNTQTLAAARAAVKTGKSNEFGRGEVRGERGNKEGGKGG